MIWSQNSIFMQIKIIFYLWFYFPNGRYTLNTWNSFLFIKWCSVRRLLWSIVEAAWVLQTLIGSILPPFLFLIPLEILTQYELVTSFVPIRVHIYQILYIVEGILVLCPYWFIAMKWLFLTKQGPYMWNNQDIMSKNCFRWFDHVQPGAMNTPLQNSFFWFEQITWYVGQKE